MHALYLAIVVSLLLLVTPAQGQRAVDRTVPAAQGLVAWWRVLPGISGGGQWYDLMGRFNATLTNMAAAGTSGWGATTRAGGQGEVRFDGTNDYATTPSSALLYPPAFTLTVWLKRTAAGSDYQRVLSHPDGGSRHLYVRQAGTVSTSVLVSAGGGTSIGHDNVGGPIDVGTWYFLSMSYDTVVGFSFARNCVQQFSDSQNGTAFTITNVVLFGSNSDGTVDRFTGAMDDVRLYNRVLPTAELCAIMRESSLGDRRLLPPTPLQALLVPPSVATGQFFPFFLQPQ
jgi:Concanavalin A-like lectin/glucanases superfamily